MTKPSAAPAQFPIRTLAELTGVSPITLRAWERRYGFLAPVRTAAGHRLYTHEHVERVRRVLALVEQGIPVGRAGGMLATPAEPARPRGPWDVRLEHMAAAIARLDEQELERAYDEALSLHPVDEVTRRLLLPLLERLGERWQGLPGAIAEEHFFAVFMRSKLGARLLHSARRADGPRLLAACAPGERHEIGLLLFAIAAHGAGLRTLVLGADVPLDELAQAQKRAACEAIVISCSIPQAFEALLRGLPAFVRNVGVPVFVGGTGEPAWRAAIAAAGAVAAGSDVEDGVRLIGGRLAARARSR